MAIDINQLALLGVGSVISLMMIAVLAQIGLSYLAQRNLNDQLSVGIQAIVGTNNIRTIDDQMNDRRGGETGNVVVDNREGSQDTRSGNQ